MNLYLLKIQKSKNINMRKLHKSEIYWRHEKLLTLESGAKSKQLEELSGFLRSRNRDPIKTLTIPFHSQMLLDLQSSSSRLFLLTGIHYPPNQSLTAFKVIIKLQHTVQISYFYYGQIKLQNLIIAKPETLCSWLYFKLIKCYAWLSAANHLR